MDPMLWLKQILLVTLFQNMLLNLSYKALHWSMLILMKEQKPAYGDLAAPMLETELEDYC